MYQITDEYRQYFGEDLTDEELAEAMGINLKKLGWLKQVGNQQPTSLSMLVHEDDPDSDELGELIPGAGEKVSDQVEASLLHEDLEEALETLKPRTADILRLRFGLTDGNPYTLEEVGGKYGVTRERIRQVQKDGLRELRHNLSLWRKLAGYLSEEPSLRRYYRRH